MKILCGIRRNPWNQRKRQRAKTQSRGSTGSLYRVRTPKQHSTDDLGLDFRLAFAGAEVEDDPFLNLGAFDPCI
jgi:hypothetical protein